MLPNSFGKCGQASQASCPPIAEDFWWLLGDKTALFSLLEGKVPEGARLGAPKPLQKVRPGVACLLAPVAKAFGGWSGIKQPCFGC